MGKSCDVKARLPALAWFRNTCQWSDITGADTCRAVPQGHKFCGFAGSHSAAISLAAIPSAQPRARHGFTSNEYPLRKCLEINVCWHGHDNNPFSTYAYTN